MMDVFRAFKLKMLSAGSVEAKSMHSKVLNSDHILIALIENNARLKEHFQLLNISVKDIRRISEEISTSSSLPQMVPDFTSPLVSKWFEIADSIANEFTESNTCTLIMLKALARLGSGVADRLLVRLGIDLTQLTSVLSQVPSEVSPLSSGSTENAWAICNFIQMDVRNNDIQVIGMSKELIVTILGIPDRQGPDSLEYLIYYQNSEEWHVRLTLQFIDDTLDRYTLSRRSIDS